MHKTLQNAFHADKSLAVVSNPSYERPAFIVRLHPVPISMPIFLFKIVKSNIKLLCKKDVPIFGIMGKIYE